MAAATVIVCLAALLARAQSAITGRVVADDTGDPIPNARISLAATAPGTPVVLSDADGRFTLPAASGRLNVVAGKSGYAHLDVAPPSAGAPLEIRLRKGAAISGRVVDEFGDPIPSARVAVERIAEPARIVHTPEGASVPGAVPALAVTDSDDRGDYRLASLPAGAFLVAVTTVSSAMSARVVNGTQTVYGPGIYKAYYPGVDAATEAQEIRLQAGDDRRGIDFVVSATRTDNQPDNVIRFGGDAPPGLRAQQDAAAARPAGGLRGRVTGTDGRGLPHAQVRLIAMNGVLPTPRIARADESGAFEFRDLPAGRYRALASKAGYSLEPSGQLVIVDLGDGQTREGADLRLAHWGTLEGQVMDEIGEPVQGASVQVLQVRYEAGRRRLVPAAGSARSTDDLGRYRLYGIPPGLYIVSAAVGTVSSADLPGYTRSYFPGSASPGQAQFVSVGLSQDVTGVDVALVRARTARVIGKILGADGAPSTGGSLTLIPSWRSSSVTIVPVGARILPDGTFEFPNVPPGQYVVQANRGRRNSSTEGEFGALPVSVDGTDVTNLVLQMAAGSSISGRFTFDTPDRTKTPRRGAIELSPIPVDFDQSPQNAFASADIHDDWSFEMAGINGPRRLQLLHAPAGWALKEIRVNGIDATDRPLPFGRADQSLRDVEVVLTDRVSELSGTIGDDHGTAAPGARVIVFSTDRARWYPASRFLYTATAGADAAFTIAGLPFGSYYAAAVGTPTAGDEDGWQDPQLLESLVPRASSVTVRDGEKQTLTLRLPPR